ncbi:MAG TPA: hypothetical protein VFI96_05870 [Longimicrobiaceae bacterium]|nr:hypothetical protein [Longimicrobiaceae bacterium]
MGLIVVAAVAASLSVARHRGEERGVLEPEPAPGRIPAPTPPPPRVDLDAIRSAGL